MLIVVIEWQYGDHDGGDNVGILVMILMFMVEMMKIVILILVMINW